MRKFFLLITLIMIPFIFSGCIQVGEKNDLGGVFKSIDKGAAFQQKVLMSTPRPSLVSIGNADITAMEQDPQDHNAIYIGTPQDGLYYSYDGAESWHKAASLGQIKINSIEISPDNKCTIYTSSLNKIFLSRDCNRTYKEIYHDPRVSVIITEIESNPENTSIIFAGTSAGDILKSEDKGESWSHMHNFNAMVKSIIFDQKTKNVFAATTNSIYKLSGKDWTDISGGGDTKQYFRNIKKIEYIKENNGGHLLTVLTSANIIVSRDEGKTWELLKLITPSGKVALYSMDINVKNTNEIIYGTANALVSSTDGGKTWTSSKLPSVRAPIILMIDKEMPNIIYMGMYNLQQ